MISPDSSFPVFTVKDLAAAKSFYTGHLGFNVAFEGEWYLHLATESGVQVGFLLPDQPTQPSIFHPVYSGSGVIFSLEVEDADAAYAHALEKSLDVVLELRSEEWGQRHFALRDPNGVYLDIVQAFEPTDEYKKGYVEE
jgi:catechol 2,3-dioxygenase-like lactoylglutathione lyase family enzyme